MMCLWKDWQSYNWNWWKITQKKQPCSMWLSSGRQIIFRFQEILIISSYYCRYRIQIYIAVHFWKSTMKKKLRVYYFLLINLNSKVTLSFLYQHSAEYKNCWAEVHKTSICNIFLLSWENHDAESQTDLFF